MTTDLLDVAPERAGFSRKRLERITEHLERQYIAPGKIAGCSVLVNRDGHVAYRRSFGFMDRERQRPMRDDAIFRIYSMTKPITSVALMQLFEEGRFTLNDPIQRVIPEWGEQRVYLSGEGEHMQTRVAERPMTFRHVLSHTGGLTYGATDHPVDRVYQKLGVSRGRGETLRSFIEKLAGVPLYYAPGERWLYSISTDVCGYLVEALSGIRFDRYLQQRIFEPLGMVDTSFWVAPEKTERFAANYQRGADKQLQLLDDPTTSAYLTEPSFFSGGGGLTGTIDDYARFCDMLRRWGELGETRILGRHTLELMTKNFLPGGSDLASTAIGSFSETAYEGVGFGLGFAMTLSDVGTGTLGQGDYYWGGAASTIFWVDPREDLFVVFMTQLMPSNTFNFRGQLKNIIYSSLEQ